MCRLYAFCFKDKLVSFLPLFLDLSQELVVLHIDDFFLGGQCLLCLDFQFHVIIEKLFILAVVTDPLEFLVHSASFSEVVITDLHVAKSAMFYQYVTIFSSLLGQGFNCRCYTDLYPTQIPRLLIS